MGPTATLRSFPSVTRCIAHLDMDAFYVAVELQRRPELRGKPVVVSGAGPRAVVTTASYEARKFGVFSAIPAARARTLCPDAVFLPPDFELYRARSGDVMDVLRSHVDLVEQVGLDEAYLDLSDYDRPKAAARRVKAEVQERTGLTCSIGLGPSKLVAKVASDAEKPDGFVALTADEARERFADSRPGLIPGIGPRTAERLAARGITTLRELRGYPAAKLIDEFGSRHGPYLQALANFDDHRTVETVRLVKSESRETTFDHDVSDPVRLEETLGSLTLQLCERMVKQRRKGRTIGIKVRLDDFSTHTRATTLPVATNDVEEVRSVATQLLRRFAAPRPVRLIGVRLAALEGEGAEHAPAAADPQLALPL